MKTKLFLSLLGSLALAAAVNAVERKLGQLPDGRLYLKDEIDFALKEHAARRFSPAGNNRRAVDKTPLRAMHRAIGQIMGGHTSAKRWLAGQELPARARGQNETVPRVARTLKAKLREDQDAAIVVKELETHPDIEWANLIPVHRIDSTPNDTFWSSQWGPAAILAPSAWDISPASENIRIAIIDTGVDLHHPDLESRIVYDAGFAGNSDGDAPHTGGNGSDHGTHVAGIAAAIRDNTKGIAGIANAKIMAMCCAVWGGSGYLIAERNTVFASDASSAVNDAVDNGADVINCSFSMSPLYNAMENALDYAQSAGVLVVMAAGNDTNNVASSNAQGWDDHAWPLIVSATSQSDQLTSFSNFGSAIDLAAPGLSILSTIPTWMGTNDSKDGTSMAAPHVAGAAAVAKSMNPSLISGSGMKDLLYRMAKDLGPAGEDNSYGNGLVQLDPTFLKIAKEATAFVGITWLPEVGTYEYPYNDLSTAVADVPSGSTLVLNGGIVNLTQYDYPAVTITNKVILTAFPDRPVVIGTGE